MVSKPGWYYEWKTGLGLSSLLPPLALPAYAVIWWAGEGRWTQGDLRPLVRAFEVALPLLAALSAAHLMSVEREQRFGELRSTYAENRWRLPLVRTAGALLLAGATALAGALSFRLAFGPFSPTDVVLPAVGPALYLLGLALVVNNLAGNYWVSAAAVMGCWFFEVLTRGAHTGLLYLFQKTWPAPGLDYGLNRWTLAAAGLALMLLNAWISARRRSTR